MKNIFTLAFTAIVCSTMYAQSSGAMDAQTIKKQIQGTFLFESVDGKNLAGKNLPEKEMDAIKKDLCIGFANVSFYEDNAFILSLPKGCKAEGNQKGFYEISEKGIISLTFSLEECKSCGNKMEFQYFYQGGLSKLSPLGGDDNELIIITLK